MFNCFFVSVFKRNFKQKERKRKKKFERSQLWIGVKKDLLVIEPHTIYFVDITVMKKETLRSMKNGFFLLFKFKSEIYSKIK